MPLTRLTVPSFEGFLGILEGKGASQANYKSYRKGQERLKNAVLQHPEGDDIFDFVGSAVNKQFWQSDPGRVSKICKKNDGK